MRVADSWVGGQLPPKILYEPSSKSPLGATLTGSRLGTGTLLFLPRWRIDGPRFIRSFTDGGGPMTPRLFEVSNPSFDVVHEAEQPFFQGGWSLGHYVFLDVWRNRVCFIKSSIAGSLWSGLLALLQLSCWHFTLTSCGIRVLLFFDDGHENKSGEVPKRRGDLTELVRKNKK